MVEVQVLQAFSPKGLRVRVLGHMGERVYGQVLGVGVYGLWVIT